MKIPPQNNDAVILRPHSAKSIFHRWWFWLLLLLVITGSYLYFNNTQKTEKISGKPNSGRGQGDKPTPVTAIAAKSLDVNVFINGLGTVIPTNIVTVRSRVDGELTRVLFREGDMVKKGDLIAEIDPRPYQVQLTQAQGQMARDQALLKNAQVDLERYRHLFEQDSIAKQEVDTQAALVRQYQGTVKSDQGLIENAKLQLTYSKITAPISGRLGLRQVDPGNIVHASDTNGIVVIAQLQPVTAIFTIPEDNLPVVMNKLRANEKISVDAYDREGKKKLTNGTLLTVDNQIDVTTGTVKLKAQFPNDDYSLFPNQFVNIRMLVDIRKAAIVIPVSAIQRGTKGTYVYVVTSDKTVTVRPVKLGPAEGENAAIDTGLALGEMVVVDGTDKLRENAKVDVITKDSRSVEGNTQTKQHEGRHKKHDKSEAAAK